MKKLLSVLLFSLLLFCCAIAEDVISPAFRYGLTFDSTLEDIKAAEGKEPALSLGKYIMYQDVLAANRPAELLYLMGDDNTIEMAVTIFKDTHSEEQLYVLGFDTLDGQLTDKYGEPISDREIRWFDDLFMDDPSNLGLAVSSGQASIISQWEMDGLYIVHGLLGDNYNIQELLLYTPENPAGTSVNLIGVNGGDLGI